MALPPSVGDTGEQQRASVAVSRRRDAMQRLAQQLSLVRRKGSSLYVEAPPTEQLVTARHVLQSDFANRVLTPSAGAVEVEVVFDGDQIRFYVVP